MVVDTSYYDLLLVKPLATPEEISKSYKRLALKYHPDKTKDPKLTETFKEMTRAYEVLRDSKQRKIYDSYGAPGLDGSSDVTPFDNVQFSKNMFSMFDDLNNILNMKMGMNMSNMMNGMGMGMGMDMNGMGMNMNMSMNGMGMNMGMNMPMNVDMDRSFQTKITPIEQQLKQGKDIHHTCSVTLSDLYYGKIIKLYLPKNCKCEQCFGYGGTNPQICQICQGSGNIMITKFNQFTKFQTFASCSKCHGKGHFIEQPCQACFSKGYSNVKKLLTINLPPGSFDKNKIVLKNQGDEGRNLIPGDVIIHIKQLPHKFLIRKFHDLYMNYDLDLKLALLGGDLIIPNFLKPGNNLKIQIDTKDIGTINSNQPKLIKNFGMPINHNIRNNIIIDEGSDPNQINNLSNYQFGNLFVNFNVIIPDVNQFSQVQLTNLSQIPLSNQNHQFNEHDLVLNGQLSNIPDFKSSSKSSNSLSPHIVESDSDMSDQYSYNDIEITDSNDWNDSKKRRKG